MTKKSILTKANVDKVAEFLKNSASDFADGHPGCSRFNLSDDLAIYVGWLSGYAFDGEDVLTVGDGYALNAAVKVRNDDDWSDYECLDFPTYDDGDCYDSGGSFAPNMTDEEYEEFAKALLSEFVEISNLHASGELAY